MNKINLLLEKYPNEFYELVDKLYSEKVPKKTKNSKLIFKFKVLGKTYDSNVVTKNYMAFISDIAKIHPYEMFEKCIGKCYMSREEKPIKQLHKITDGFYVTGYSSSEVKIRHIKNICDLLGIELKYL